MKIRTWPLLLVGFGALLILITISAIAVERRIDQVREDVRKLQEENRAGDAVFDDLRSNIYLFAILLRDYVLEENPNRARELRHSIETLHDSAQQRYKELSVLGFTRDPGELQQLQAAVEDYWKTAEPVFDWDAEKRALEGPEFLRNVSPKREAAFALAEKIEQFGQDESLARQQQILLTQQSLKDYLQYTAAGTLALGALVTMISILRTRWLESNVERHVEDSDQSAADLRRLSSKLSRAQEDERRSISRELHDQVGQTLTALRLELANLEAFRHDKGELFDEHLAEARKLAEETLRTVRDISLGLRPSVLDELGLAPALRWQAREFTRRTGVPVDLEVKGNLDSLEEAPRTCVYRVVQEALTNCARHAQASQIRVGVRGTPEGIRVDVEDDGVGFDVAVGRSRGLGLLGAEERVKELGGTLEIRSGSARGTSVRCIIPPYRSGQS